MAKVAKKPKSITHPDSSGTYRLRLKVRAEREDPEEQWDDLFTTTRNVDVFVDTSKHCRVFTLDGKPARFEDDDFVVMQATKL